MGVVRPARVSDLPAIVDLWESLMATHVPLDPQLYETEPHGADSYRAWVRRHMDDRRGVVLVVESEAAVVGYILGAQGARSPVFSIRRVGMIFDLSVGAGNRRKGFGQLLVEAAKARFEEMGIRHLQVNYDPNNQGAAGFWQRQGFEILLCEAYADLAGS